jgi:uncharacterized OB-fold protein
MSETKDHRGRAVRKVELFLQEPEAKPFWANLSEHKLTAQRCGACGKLFSYPPQGSCPTLFLRSTSGFNSAAKVKCIRSSLTAAWHSA